MTTKIPSKIVRMYHIIVRPNKILINSPAYLKVYNPIIEITDTVIHIRNKNIVVTLWKDIKNMHITVFDK